MSVSIICLNISVQVVVFFPEFIVLSFYMQRHTKEETRCGRVNLYAQHTHTYTHNEIPLSTVETFPSMLEIYGTGTLSGFTRVQHSDGCV